MEPRRRRLCVCLPAGVPWIDPDPEVTKARGIEVQQPCDRRPAAVLGWSGGGIAALTIAARWDEPVDRLVLVAVPAPFDAIPPSIDLGSASAKTLLLFGTDDPWTGSRHGRWWQAHLPNARLEMVPGGGHDLVPAMWGRIASFVAPRGRP